MKGGMRMRTFFVSAGTLKPASSPKRYTGAQLASVRVFATRLSIIARRHARDLILTLPGRGSWTVSSPLPLLILAARFECCGRKAIPRHDDSEQACHPLALLHRVGERS